MPSSRFTRRPEYKTMELLLDIAWKATWYWHGRSPGNDLGCSLSELQATAKLRHRRYSSKRNQLGGPNC